MLLIDRYLGGHFFDTQAGGSAVIWMHFFWIFGHPEVYVLVLPAFAIVSEIIPVFSRKPIFGYSDHGRGHAGHRLHQPGRVGAPHVHRRHDVLRERVLRGVDDGDCVSRPASRSSTGWARCGAGRSASRCRCCSASRFLFQFLIAGLTGIMLSAAPFDWQLGNSYFVVAHFHYVHGRRTSSSPSSPAFYYWYPESDRHAC